MTIYGVGKLIAIEHVDKIQDKAHTQAQGNFNPKARASKCRARAHKGPAQASNYSRNTVCVASA